MPTAVIAKMYFEMFETYKINFHVVTEKKKGFEMLLFFKS